MSRLPTHESIQGYVFPTDFQAERIQDTADEELSRVPEKYQVDCYFAGGIAIDYGFEYGWFKGEVSDEDLFVISRDVREDYSVSLPFESRIDGYINSLVRLAARAGSNACTAAYNDLMLGKE